MTAEIYKRFFECGRNFQLTGENNFNEMLAIVEAEHSALKEQWISVEEPPINDEPGFVGVLIALKSGVVRQGWFNTKTNNFQTIGHDVYEKEHITHYMKTPESPVKK